MRYTLDTNICILLLAGHPAVVGRATLCDEGDVAMSSIAYAEVAHGIARGKPPPMDDLEAALRRIIILLPFDDKAARAYAALSFKRGSFDRLIGAHALSSGLTLVTNNTSDFTDIPGLRVENWTL